MLKKRFVTTGEIAKICEVSSKTVISWIDRHQLESFRIDRGPRKVNISNLFSFLSEKGFPVDSKEDLEGMVKEVRSGSQSFSSV